MAAISKRRTLLFWKRTSEPRTQASLFHYIKEEPEPSIWTELDFSVLKHPLRFLMEEWRAPRTRPSLFHYIEDQKEEPFRWGEFVKDLIFGSPPPSFIPSVLSDPREVAVDPAEVRAALRILADDEDADLKAIFSDAIAIPSRKKLIAPKSVNQRRYLEAVRKNDLVFAIGPAGTGKSYLGVAMAVSALMKRSVARIVLTRPAVEAGERLGFLPGDLYEKVHPYLRPLYDALYDMLDTERVARHIERGTIEIAPIAFMRGRTLNDSFVILDEAQNTTSEQMKMFLTRLGFGAKAVITGDVTQIDLPAGRTSGLVEAMKVVGSIEGISFVYFDDRDVVRHKLVQQIVKAYEKFSNGSGRT